MGICQSPKNKRKISEQKVNDESGLPTGDYKYMDQKNAMESNINKLEKIFKTQGKLFKDNNTMK